MTALERDAARLEGERGQLIASIAQAKGKITETELQILQIDQDMRTEVGKDLAEIRGKRSRAGRERVAAEDQLKRIDLRAPQDGIVHQLAVHTVGGVITPGEPVMLIVPAADQLDRRGQGAAAGHRPGACRPEGGAALRRLQPAHDAGDRTAR